jgi:membrane protein YdbS with pleckstrin-like domain
LEKSFKPHPNMVKLFNYYLLTAITPIVIGGLIVIWLVYRFNPALAYIPAVIFFVPVAVIVGFVSYWVRRYYRSIRYQLSRDEVIIEHGVWWKMKHTVPYARVMSVDIIQGPISRMLGIATMDIYTAGYTGVSGGTGGPGSRRAEASVMHVSNFAEIRENVLSIVRGKPLFATTVSDADTEMISELRKIRELLEKSS